jgi:hypothetical protein
MVSARSGGFPADIAARRTPGGSVLVCLGAADLASARSVAVLVDVLDQQATRWDLFKASLVGGATRLAAGTLTGHGDLGTPQDDLVPQGSSSSVSSCQRTRRRRGQTGPAQTAL